MLQNDADVSSENVWQYEGSAGLYDRWRTIFQRFRQLDLSAAAGGHGERAPTPRPRTAREPACGR